LEKTFYRLPFPPPPSGRLIGPSAAFTFFDGILGASHERSCALDFEELGLPRLDLQDFRQPFTEAEIWEVIKELPLDKAPGTDWFTGPFYRLCWSIIWRDILRAFNALSYMDFHSFHHLNGALLTLVPKKPNPVSLSDYRPISLIHSFGKLFSKVVANRFAPHLPNLISTNQSAFIKSCLIHDNFKYVLGTGRLLSSRKLPQIMFKIDLAKAFDSVGWVFLLDLLVVVGCPRNWTNWISTILSTASTRILLNGTPGERICHGCGLR
jgi:hypothetical protein